MPGPTTRPPATALVTQRDAPRARNLERSLAWLVCIGGAPGVVVALIYIWREAPPPEVRWTLVLVVVGAWLVAIAAASEITTRSLQSIASLLGALREGDYTMRGLRSPGDSAMGMVMREVNDFGSVLQRQRAEAVESASLLTHVMEEIAVAVFAFDPAGELLLVNKGGESLLGKSHKEVVGLPASALGFDEYLTGETRRLVDRAFGSRHGRYEVRRAGFFRDGLPHQLLVVTDLSQALREEEQAAWQRIVRVLSHEVNNSLTPIKSIAHSLKRIVDQAPELSRQEEMQHGLSLIEERSGALGRFLRAYAQLARLPKPRPGQLRIGELVERVVDLEKRLPVTVKPSPDVRLEVDSDQMEQLLINIVRNAVDASLETGGAVTVSWRSTGGWFELAVDDEGKGLPDTSNLFVPFFTTKPSGSGIGLALSRQIAEAHGGTITLENHAAAAGCRATLRLPLAG